MDTTRSRPLPPTRTRASLAAGALALLLSACAGDGAGPTASRGAELEIDLSRLPALDAAREGSYELWVVDADGRAHSAGRLDPRAGRAMVTNPAERATALEITLEPPGDTDPAPSSQRLLTGPIRGGRAELTLDGAITRGGMPLEDSPGQFTIYFTPSDNHYAGYPSHEEAGVWLFNIHPRDSEQGDGWVRLSPLHEGWVYEGWVVRDLGSPAAIWLSYGKFLPDPHGAVNTRDDTGWGPFSGVYDYVTAGETKEDYPGDDWISNPIGFPWPEELSLPLDLRERNAAGGARWTHVITVEPASDRGEEIMTERPFVVRPYLDPFPERMEGIVRPYGLPAPITFHPDALPRATATVR